MGALGPIHKRFHYSETVSAVETACVTFIIHRPVSAPETTFVEHVRLLGKKFKNVEVGRTTI